MNYSSHYNLNLAEGTDLVNPLTVDVPNYTAIDTQMFANEQSGVGTATELKSGTIHALTRASQNKDVFRFHSTSVFNVGDTFTVDGGTVTALYVDGSTLKDRCFIIGSDVLCILNGSQLTVLATFYPEAQNVSFDNSGTDLSATNVQNALSEVNTKVNNKPHYTEYNLTLINGWGGNVIVSLNEGGKITGMSGALLHSASVTSPVFARADVDPALNVYNKSVPVATQGGAIYSAIGSSDLISFGQDGNGWYAELNSQDHSLVVNAIYNRA